MKKDLERILSLVSRIPEDKWCTVFISDGLTGRMDIAGHLGVPCRDGNVATGTTTEFELFKELLSRVYPDADITTLPFDINDGVHPDYAHIRGVKKRIMAALIKISLVILSNNSLN